MNLTMLVLAAQIMVVGGGVSEDVTLFDECNLDREDTIVVSRTYEEQENIKTRQYDFKTRKKTVIYYNENSVPGYKPKEGYSVKIAKSGVTTFEYEKDDEQNQYQFNIDGDGNYTIARENEKEL